MRADAILYIIHHLVTNSCNYLGTGTELGYSVYAGHETYCPVSALSLLTCVL